MDELVAEENLGCLYFGGAIGGDTLALQYALQYRVGAWPQCIVIAPNKFHHLPYEAQHAARKADRVVELCFPIQASDNFLAYDLRNERLVEAAVSENGYLLAFWSGRPSGTKNAVDYARSKNYPVLHIPITGR